MKKTISVMALSAIMLMASMMLAMTASAEDFKMVGTISKIEMAADGKSATVILKDTKTEEAVVITITDELTLDKFKEKRIVEGDEIRTKYEKLDGKNNSRIFKKTAGC